MKENENSTDSSGGSIQMYEIDERKKWEHRYVSGYITAARCIAFCSQK